MLSSKVFALSDYSEISDNAKIQQTLELLSTHSAETKQTLSTITGDNLTQKPIKIMFYDLSKMNVAYANYDALTCKHKSGSLYILINNKHQNAPTEALACLLSHEVTHQDDLSSYEEEVHAWTTEAIIWISLKNSDKKLNNSELNNNDLVKRLNTIEKMYISAGYSTIEISKEVHANVGYRGLSEFSPGYGI